MGPAPSTQIARVVVLRLRPARGGHTLPAPLAVGGIDCQMGVRGSIGTTRRGLQGPQTSAHMDRPNPGISRGTGIVGVPDMKIRPLQDRIIVKRLEGEEHLIIREDDVLGVLE